MACAALRRHHAGAAFASPQLSSLSFSVRSAVTLRTAFTLCDGQVTISAHDYMSHMDWMVSDHRPVSAVFRLEAPALATVFRAAGRAAEATARLGTTTRPKPDPLRTDVDTFLRGALSSLCSD